MIGKRKCKFCAEYSRTWVKHPIGNFCTDGHVLAWINAKREKENARQRAVYKRRQAETKRGNRKALKDLNRKDLRWQHKQTQPIFNRMRVLQELKWFKSRGLEPECISCGKTKMDWCCGHFKTTGHQGAIRYDEKNTYLQCNRYCNMGLSGNITGNKNTRGYLAGLDDRFGQVEATKIIQHCEKDRIAKWDCEELEQFRAECSAEIRRMEAEA